MAKTPFNRRKLLQTLGYGALGFAYGTPHAHAIACFTPSLRYPDPHIHILDASFAKYRLHNSSLERLATGMHWTEGPVYLPSTGTLVFSDIPNNRLMQYDESTGAMTIYRDNADYPNGNSLDQQGRIITCEHLGRRLVRTEANGELTVLADQYQDKPLNSPNDVVVRSDHSVWFTDPVFGISDDWEGARATPEQTHTSVYRVGPNGGLSAVITDIINPNGLAFSPDERYLYVLESHENPHATFWRFDVSADGRALSNKTAFIDAGAGAAPDGFCVDADGNLWCGWGASDAVMTEAQDIGAGMAALKPLAQPAEYDGVKVFNPAGQAIGFIRLPERCANLAFGGPKRNRLYMTASHSLYALYVNTRAPASVA